MPLGKLQRVQNSAARIICNISRYDHVTPVLRSLHWLPMEYYFYYFYYCNIVWASTYKTNLRRLVILQKLIIRIIDKSHFNAHTGPISKELSKLKFNDIHLFNWASLCILAKIHSYLQGLITEQFLLKQSIPLLQYKKFRGLLSTVLPSKH